MMDQSCTGLPLADRHRQRGGCEFDLHMIPHGPTDDLPAEEIHDGRQIQPPLRGRNVGDIGEPDPVRGFRREVARDQVWCDRQVVTTVGGAHPARRRHDGADTVPAHQPLDPAAADVTALLAQDGMDAGAAVASAAVLMDPPDRSQERGIGGGTSAHRPITPGIIAGRRDLEHGAHQPHRIGVAMILDEAEAHVRVPAKIAIDFFKMSRSIRRRSFSWRSRAISEAWSADIGVACVVGRRAANVGCGANRTTQRRSTESRRPSSLPTEVIERPLDTTNSAHWRLYSSVNDRRGRPSMWHLLALRAYYRCPLIRRRFTKRNARRGGVK